LLWALLAGGAWGQTGPVELIRLPEGGLQPQAILGEEGALHLLYFKGDPAGGDLFYRHRAPGATAFADPVQVNSQPGSAIAIGTIRGGHLALGKRVHVAWMKAGAPDKSQMCYTRTDEQGTGFEPQRELIHTAYGLDGGGSLAADRKGGVYVAWHAGTEGEERRRVWVARSSDEGQSFAPEQRADPGETGACGCCGMKAGADRQGGLYLLYRAATGGVHRDMHLLVSGDQGERFADFPVHPWELRACPMSSASLSPEKTGMLLAWETDGQVYYTRADQSGLKTAPIPAPGEGKRRKHPTAVGNLKGEVLLVWDEGTAWSQGGALAWQHYDAQGKPTAERGLIPGGIPVWSHPAAIAYPDGCFGIVY
jgi:hypothetical protein